MSIKKVIYILLVSFLGLTMSGLDFTSKFNGQYEDYNKDFNFCFNCGNTGEFYEKFILEITEITNRIASVSRLMSSGENLRKVLECGKQKFLEKEEKEDEWRQVCFGDVCFDAEIADTKESVTQGLMFRESLDPGKGMLFGQYDDAESLCFWMKNTYVPLDIIWINKNMEIVFIEKNAEPFSEELLYSDTRSDFVLELLAGTVDRVGLNLGDTMEIKF
ncbi:DUF192 domain-containing protein [Patescibacteria group bacterium]